MCVYVSMCARASSCVRRDRKRRGREGGGGGDWGRHTDSPVEKIVWSTPG